MAQTGKPAAAGYKFNSMQEIKSHSSILFNERMAILFYLLDMRSIELNSYHEIDELLKVKSIIVQIYKNIRTLIRNNPTMRATLNLDTKEDGVYITDVVMDTVEKMVFYCESNEYTYKKIYIITQELNKIELILKDILQYYHYFIRPDFRQKPDVEIATEKYKHIADEKTIDELKAVVGKNHKIDFDSFGTDKIELKSEVEFDTDVDSQEVDYEEEEPDEEEDKENGIKSGEV